MVAKPNASFSQTARFFITLAAIGVSVWFLSSYRDLVNAIFLAQLVVLTASPAMYWLRQRNLPQWLSILVGMVLTLSITLLIAFAIFASALRVIELLPAFTDALQQFLTRSDSLFTRYGIDLDYIFDQIDTNQLVSLLGRGLQSIVSTVSMFGLMVLILVFMVIEALIFPDKIRKQVEGGNERFGRIFGFTPKHPGIPGYHVASGPRRRRHRHGFADADRR